MAGWRFFLLALPSFEWVDKNLPLSGAVVVHGPNIPTAIQGKLPAGYDEIRRADGELALTEWGCAIVAQEDDREPRFAIVDGITIDNDELQIDAGGFTGYPAGMPWMGPEFTGIDVDPLDMVRKIWDHLQSYPDGYLAITVDDTTTPPSQWVGDPVEEVSFETGSGELVEFEAGPFRLASWTTDDLGRVISDLAEETPFEFRERSYWNGESIENRLELGYPQLGVRRNDVRFHIGINVMAPPPLEEGEYASEIWMQGAGEGRERLKTSSHLTQSTGKMRRVHVVTDKSIKSKVAATRAARPILDRLVGRYDLDTLEVIDHDLAPFGSFEGGDEVYVSGDAGWIQVDHWVRITEITEDCDTGKKTLKVVTV